jgi:hypothetical protein
MSGALGAISGFSGKPDYLSELRISQNGFFHVRSELKANDEPSDILLRRLLAGLVIVVDAELAVHVAYFLREQVHRLLCGREPLESLIRLLDQSG